MNSLPDQDGMVIQQGVCISVSTPPPTEVLFFYKNWDYSTLFFSRSGLVTFRCDF